jgi:hypothetical protein
MPPRLTNEIIAAAIAGYESQEAYLLPFEVGTKAGHVPPGASLSDWPGGLSLTRPRLL